MSMMAGMELPMAAIRDQVARAVNLIVQQTRMRDGSRRITAITEVVGVEHGEIRLQDLFLFHYNRDRDSAHLGELVATGNQPNFLHLLEQRGVHLDKSVFKK
jgi:pilus assembly protein CpaF